MKYTDLQSFFYERMIELFQKDTIDSFRVRCNNSLSLLDEAIYLIQCWNENKIKQFETLQLCFEELLSTIENDTCIDYSFYSKKLFRQDIEEYIKSNGKEVHKSRQVLHILSKCIEHNRPTYIKLSFKKIEDIIFQKGRFKKENLMSILIELDPIITNLGCELVNIGFSKINIYLKTRRIFEHTRDFKKAFEIFKSIFTNTNPIKHTVIFRFRLPQKLISLNIFNETLDQTYITEYTKRRFNSFITPQKYMRYYWVDTSSLDQSSAVKEAKNKLLLLLDNLHLGLNSLDVNIPYTALVIKHEEDGDFYTTMTTDYEVDGSFSDDIEKAKRFENRLSKIFSNNSITKDVKDRIQAALRHLRVGNVNAEIEQRFINYWIALEFIFSSADKEISTYLKLKTNLVQILITCYAKRNLIYLNKLFSDNGITDCNIDFWNLKEKDRDNAIGKCSSIWLQYRYFCIKSSLLTHSDKRKKYIQRHEKNLAQQISRIYRFRNELIHEAAIKHDLENITGNLRYYLVFILSQMIGYYYNISENNKFITLDDFFCENRIRYRSIVDTYDLNSLISVPIEIDLL